MTIENLIGLLKLNDFNIFSAGLVEYLDEPGHTLDDKRADDGDTLLLTAAWKNKTEECELLLEKGANIEIKNQAGFTPLFLAAKKGNICILNLLIKKGASVNVQTPSGKTALMEAAAKGYLNTVDLILNAGAQINMKDNQQDNALSWAVRKDYKNTCNFLIRQGANVEPCLSFLFKRGASDYNIQYDTIFKTLSSAGRWIPEVKKEFFETPEDQNREEAFFKACQDQNTYNALTEERSKAYGLELATKTNLNIDCASIVIGYLSPDETVGTFFNTAFNKACQLSAHDKPTLEAAQKSPKKPRH